MSKKGVKCKAKDVFEMMKTALEKANPNRPNITIKKQFENLVISLNECFKPEKDDSSFKANTLQKNLYTKSRKHIEGNNPNYVLNFESWYLDSLSIYVYEKKYEEQFQPVDENLNSSLSTDLFEIWGIREFIPTLINSIFSPINCLSTIYNELDFMGILGNKWIENENLMELFEKFLLRVSNNQGKVRFLILNPNSNNYKNYVNLEKDNPNNKTTNHLLELTKKYDCFKVKLYDANPCFRLTFVDRTVLAFSVYRLDTQSYIETQKGWKSPHFVIHPENRKKIDEKIQIERPMSLYAPFRSYFESVWTHS